MERLLHSYVFDFRDFKLTMGNQHLCIAEGLAKTSLTILSLIRSCFKRKVIGSQGLIETAVACFKKCRESISLMGDNHCDEFVLKYLWSHCG